MEENLVQNASKIPWNVTKAGKRSHTERFKILKKLKTPEDGKASMFMDQKHCANACLTNAICRFCLHQSCNVISGCGATHIIPMFGRKRLVALCDFKNGLVYIVSSKPVRKYIVRSCVKKKKKVKKMLEGLISG